MHELILWAGFGGAWLLVVGPLYQAVLELNEEDVEVDRLRAKMSTAAYVAPPSRWWWLVPPVAWVLRHRHREQVRELVVNSLDDHELAALTAYVNKARGWMYVGLGGLLIAVKETYELVEGLEWPLWLFWALVVVMAVVAVANCVYSLHQQPRADANTEQPTGVDA